MKWQTKITIGSLALNIMVCAFYFSSVMAAGTTVSMPVLNKGQGYVLTIPSNGYTCVDLENQLGLKRGDIEMITTTSENSIIQFKKDVIVTSTQAQLATDLIKGLIPKVETK